MKLEHIFKIEPIVHKKVGSPVERTIVAFGLKMNPRNVVVSMDDISDVPCAFFINFYDASGKTVDEQLVEWYQVTSSYKLSGMTQDEAIIAKNKLIGTLISGSNQEKLQILTEYSAINGITVLPQEQQGPLYYEPFLYGEPGFVEPTPTPGPLEVNQSYQLTNNSDVEQMILFRTFENGPTVIMIPPNNIANIVCIKDTITCERSVVDVIETDIIVN